MADPLPGEGMNAPTQVKLRPHQIEHFAKIEAILTSYHAAGDTSDTGAGKTHTTLAFAQKYNMPVIVICPVTVKSVWERWGSTYGIHVVTISYASLRSRKGSQPKHGFLVRNDSIQMNAAGKEVNVITFQETDKLKNYLRNNALIVFDEAHNAKNVKSAASIACFSLTRAVVRHIKTVQATKAHVTMVAHRLGFTYEDALSCIRDTTPFANGNEGARGKQLIQELTRVLQTQEFYGDGSRVLVLSATPFDKPEFCFAFARVLGISQHAELYTVAAFGQNYDLGGYNDMLEQSRKWNQALAMDIHSTLRLKKKMIEQNAFRLYTEIIKKTICSSMKAEKLDRRKLVGVNLSMNIGDVTVYRNERGREVTSMELAETAKVLLIEAMGGNVDNLQLKSGSLAKINKAITMMELSKLPAIVRLVVEILYAHPRSHIVLGVWTKDAQNILKEALAEYSPLMLVGSTPEKNRPAMIDAFQSADMNYRVLITHPRVGGVGVSLDDTRGDSPRFEIIVPHYFFIAMHQMMGRIDRTTTRSQPTVMIPYSHDFLMEQRILDAVARKTNTTKSVVVNNEGVTYLGDFQPMSEEDFLEQQVYDYLDVVRVQAVITALAFGYGWNASGTAIMENKTLQ